MALVTLTENERRPGPFPAGRRCAHPECITVLHTRHEGDYCYQHEDDEPMPELSLIEWMRKP